jgi:hypothetical protein
MQALLNPNPGFAASGSDPEPGFCAKNLINFEQFEQIFI